MPERDDPLLQVLGADPMHHATGPAEANSTVQSWRLASLDSTSPMTRGVVVREQGGDDTGIARGLAQPGDRLSRPALRAGIT